MAAITDLLSLVVAQSDRKSLPTTLDSSFFFMVLRTAVHVCKPVTLLGSELFSVVLAACVTMGTTLLSSCSQSLSQLLSNKQLGLGTSDATILAAVTKAKLDPSAACCTALTGFLTAGKGSYASCTCDATILASRPLQQTHCLPLSESPSAH